MSAMRSSQLRNRRINYAVFEATKRDKIAAGVAIMTGECPAMAF
jgi:hypothetical protein